MIKKNHSIHVINTHKSLSIHNKLFSYFQLYYKNNNIGFFRKSSGTLKKAFKRVLKGGMNL